MSYHEIMVFFERNYFSFVAEWLEIIKQLYGFFIVVRKLEDQIINLSLEFLTSFVGIRVPYFLNYFLSYIHQFSQYLL